MPAPRDFAEVTYFDPPPGGLPATFASPFDPGEPHPLARRAAEELIGRVRGRASLDAPGGGKMFGVLVVAAPDGRIGYLRGFSGMLDGQWQVVGFVPPLFDPSARDAFWPAGQRRLAELDQRLRELAASPDHDAVRAEHAAITARHAAELAALRARHRDRRADRHAAREAIRAARDSSDPAGFAASAAGALDAMARHVFDPGCCGAFLKSDDLLCHGIYIPVLCMGLFSMFCVRGLAADSTPDPAPAALPA